MQLPYNIKNTRDMNLKHTSQFACSIPDTPVTLKQAEGH